MLNPSGNATNNADEIKNPAARLVAQRSKFLWVRMPKSGIAPAAIDVINIVNIMTTARPPPESEGLLPTLHPIKVIINSVVKTILLIFSKVCGKIFITSLRNLTVQSIPVLQ
jgi:hypothetical protein